VGQRVLMDVTMCVMVYRDTDVSEEVIFSIFKVQLEDGGVWSLLNAANNMLDYTQSGGTRWHS
jgi:hypothetical protein